VLTVTNTGPEIPADEAKRLFEPFHRGSATRMSNGEGHHGLGLSIVRAIAATHGATVTASPRPGGGLVVRFEAPIGLSARNAIATRRSPIAERDPPSARAQSQAPRGAAMPSTRIALRPSDSFSRPSVDETSSPVNSRTRSKR